jgi:hypothetical protein
MPKFLILKHYTGGPEPLPSCTPMSELTTDEIRAHIEFQRHVCQLLVESGEFVGAEGLSPEGVYVRYDGEGRPPVTDGPFPESKELIAGWFLVDVESKERAYEIAALASSEPGAGGLPMQEWLEVREVLGGSEETPIDDVVSMITATAWPTAG